MGENRDHNHGHEHGHEHRHGRGPLAAIRELLRPHSHDSHDLVDRALEASAEGLRTLAISLVVLLLTAGIEAAVVVSSGSVALLADAIHNFADALTAVPLALAFWVGRRSPSRRYTYGYGRAEDLAGLFIVLVITLSAISVLWQAVDRFRHPAAVTGIGWVALAGLVGFAGNQVAAVYRIRVGRRIGSAALVADGLHARTDAITSLGVVVSAIGLALGFGLADPVIAVLIAISIVGVLFAAAREIYRRIMDSVDPELVAAAERVLAATPGIERVDSVRLRWIGHRLLADARVVSDCELTLLAAHDIAEQAHHDLLHAMPQLAEAVIHSDPCDHLGHDPHAHSAHHFSRGVQPSG